MLLTRKENIQDIKKKEDEVSAFKLVVKKVDNVPIENVVNVYDIELVDSTNNKIDIRV